MVSGRLYKIMKRMFDITVSISVLVLGAAPLLLAGLLVRLNSKGPALHWSKRVGKDNKIFKMAKFRTMKIDTPQVATHLMTNPQDFVTSIGKIYRKLSIDEFPQFINVLLGQMSLVGPRPALFNQDDLIALRTSKEVHLLTPGLTGWAQVCGRDELSIPDKVNYDEYYLNNRSFLFDLKILFLTVINVLGRKGVHH